LGCQADCFVGKTGLSFGLDSRWPPVSFLQFLVERNAYFFISTLLDMVESVSEEVEKKAEKVVKAGADVVKTSVSIGRDLWQQVKIEALKRGLSFAEVTQAALKKWLELEEQRKKKGEKAES
jgi:hypothetical protein